MNDQEYLNRLWANPADQSPEFLAARGASPERLSLWHNAQALEGRLHRVLKAPQPSAQLQAVLLALPATDAAAPATEAPPPAANDSIWRRALPVAACLALTLLLAIRFTPAPANAALEDEILRHVYAEEQFLESRMLFSLTEVNAQMKAAIGAHLEASPDTKDLNVRFVKDCWVARAAAMHLIFDGDTGPVSMMLLAKKVVDEEMPINDEEFNGMVIPVRGGTMVVLGTRREPLRKYVQMIDDNLEWQY